MMLFEAVFCGFCAIALVFVVCESGQQFSNAFSNFDHILGQLDWYLLPKDIQLTLSVIIELIHLPNVFLWIIIFSQCFRLGNNCKCAAASWNFMLRKHYMWTRNIQKGKRSIEIRSKQTIVKSVMVIALSFQVVNTAYTYFMMFHKFNKWSTKCFNCWPNRLLIKC